MENSEEFKMLMGNGFHAKEELTLDVWLAIMMEYYHTAAADIGELGSCLCNNIC